MTLIIVIFIIYNYYTIHLSPAIIDGAGGLRAGGSMVMKIPDERGKNGRVRQRKALSVWKLKRQAAAFMAAVMVLNTAAPAALDVYASTMPEGTTVKTAQYMDNTLQCIDAYKDLGPNGGYYHDNDSYTRVAPSSSLSSKEEGILFWGLFFMFGIVPADSSGNMAGYPDMNFKEINTAYANLQKSGLQMSGMQFTDFNRLIHNSSVLGKYPLISKLATDETEAAKYLAAMGLMGGGSTSSVSGKTVPSVFEGHMSASSPLDLSSSLSVDTGDAEFLKAVKVEFSSDGENFSTAPVNGWSYTISGSVITFKNDSGNGGKAVVRFNTEGTAYQTAGGSYSSVSDVYENCLELWTQTGECTGGKTGKKVAASAHQRFVSLSMEAPSGTSMPYAALTKSGSGEGSAEAGFEFNVYRHLEDWTTHYNTQLTKYDYETGEPLEGASFYVYERFDDSDEVDTEKDGAVHLYEGGSPYDSAYMDDPVIWDEFRQIGGVTTDGNGYAEFTKEHRYHYEKTFCDGHPAPEFCEVPEEEEDPETGEIVNQDEIDEAQEANMAAAEGWQATLLECEEKASDFDGVHFHWLMEGVDESAIAEAAASGGEPGDTPDGGVTASADGDEAYEKSGCMEDCEATYDKFINMRYSYTFKEIKARAGYTLHDNHTDDIPIEVITTNSSEGGAVSSFAGLYDSEISINDVAAAGNALTMTLSDLEEAHAYTLSETEAVSAEPVFAELSAIIKSAVSMFGMEEEETKASAKETLEETAPADTEEALEAVTESAGNGEWTEAESKIKEEETESPETESKASETEALEEDSNEEASGIKEDAVEVSETSINEEEEDKAESPGINEEAEEETESIREEALVPHEACAFTESRQSFGKASAKVDAGRGFFSGLFEDITENFMITAYAAEGSGPESIFEEAYAESEGDDSGEKVTVGPSGNYSHCNDADGEGNMWRIYDHRIEGEIHFNKRDLDLSNDTGDEFSDYGESNGDGTLEGAVYGLFAAEDIVHPDGKTGAVYKTDDLVAVASTDRDGNGSFLVYTLDPGASYDYKTGSVIRGSIRDNLYDRVHTEDDYTADGEHVREYPSNKDMNGGCYAGRPLILGSYYIKELSRSEGYELSIGLSDHEITNYGEDPDVKAGSGASVTGTAVVDSNPVYEVQITGTHAYGEEPVPSDPDYNEIYFDIATKGTGSSGYGLLLGNFPAGTKLYRYEEGEKTVTIEAGTGEYEERTVTDENGAPVMAAASTDHEYIKYDDAGEPVIKVTYPNLSAKGITRVSDRAYDSDKTEEALKTAEDTLSESEVADLLTKEYDDSDFLFVKAKTERALRANGTKTPSESGKYSSVSDGVFNEGSVSEGTYGAPLLTIEIKGGPLSCGDLAASITDFYSDGGYYTFGGVEDISFDGDETYTVELYAAYGENAGAFYTEADGVAAVFYPVAHDGDTDKMNRYVYAVYTEEERDFLPDGTAVFGTYSELKEAGGKMTAVLKTRAAAADKDSFDLSSYESVEMEYYPEGTCPVYGPDGNIIYKTEWVEKTSAVEVTASADKWSYVLTTGTESEKVTLSAVYTDSFGKGHDDADGAVTQFLAVVPSDGSMTVTLTEDDVAAMGGKNVLGYEAGDGIPVAEWYVLSKGVYVKAYGNVSEGGGISDTGSFVKEVTLSDPGQTFVMQDGGTVNDPVRVYERPVRQSVAVKKDILLNADTDGDGNGDSYRNNTYDADEITELSGFRFKAYLKSNLERLYRDEDGNVTWLDRNGNELIPHYYDASGNETSTGNAAYVKWETADGLKDFPQEDKLKGTALFSSNVEKIYTRTAHRTDSLTTGILSNSTWNDYLSPQGGLISDAGTLKAFTSSLRSGTAGLTGTEAVTVNSALYSYMGRNSNFLKTDRLNDDKNEGFTRILETVEKEYEDGTGALRTTEEYNYEKFFDAISAADHDKWDDSAPTYTSWRPVGNQDNRSEDQLFNAARSDAVRQFAIDWYLEDEAAKLMTAVKASYEGGSYHEDEAAFEAEDNTYGEELYDRALKAAIIKAEDYLAPFFKYDLDAIYSVAWDSAAGGGEDKDRSTLTVTSDGKGSVYGTSSYLPYGDYVVTEEQPRYTGTDKDFSDFLNKHYKTEKPKAVSVPSLYAESGSGDTNDNFDPHYCYDPGMTPEDEASSGNYMIRFNEEWMQETEGTYAHVVRAHSYYGDFEVYPYGLDTDNTASNTAKAHSIKEADGSDYHYLSFTLTQEEGDPLKDYYRLSHKGEGGKGEIGSTGGGNDGSRYDMSPLSGNTSLTDNGSYYDLKALEDRYFYASVSEDEGSADCVMYKGGASDSDNASGMYFKDDVRTMTGVLTAYDGKYASMLVPWTVTNAEDLDSYSSAVFTGFADLNERNTYYYSKLRIEKLDSETHENILHDSAVFAIYKAERWETAGEGHEAGDVKFHDTDTLITGSKEFVESVAGNYKAEPVDPDDIYGEYKAVVPAGTPVFKEEDRVVLGDRFGTEVSEFKSFSTAADINMKDEETDKAPLTYAVQTTGYIETPQPLGAGVYVLVEEKAPAGYVRTAPVAVEVYSDKVTYYKEGNKDERILAAIYEEELPEGEISENGNKPQDETDVAKVYIEDAPIKLRFEKVKESDKNNANTTADKTVTYRVSGRVDGKLADIGGDPDLEYAYLEGSYQGYAWYKGTLEYLASRKAAGEDVDIVYDGSLFAGYGFVTRTLETADDENGYAAGALVTMSDAIDIYESGYTGDHKYKGLNIVRNSTSNVTRMYVEEGYAGWKVDFVPETEDDGSLKRVSYAAGYTTSGVPVMEEGYVWSAKTIKRHDTDILYYDLDGLSVTTDETVDGKKFHYGYDRSHNKVDIARLEADKANYEKTDTEFSLYALKNGVPYLEFTGGDFTKISYSAGDKTITTDPETKVYHLDGDGNRDSLVDPMTGMAYVTEMYEKDGVTEERVLVWPVNLRYDEYGNIIARDKISTERTGTIFENDASKYDAYTSVDVINNSFDAIDASSMPSYEHAESGSVTGSWASEGSGESHHETTVRVNAYGGNLNGQILVDDNNGEFLKEYDPVYDSYGNILYYQRSAETYDKASDLYDRNGDFVRQRDSDHLEEYNNAAYKLNSHEELYDGDEYQEAEERKSLWHRFGEGYILENTWTTSEFTPNDPFTTSMTDGQADIIKRLPEGKYILEELKAPDGYQKALPVGITVDEKTELHELSMTDKTTKLEIAKTDAASGYTFKYLSMDEGGKILYEGNDIKNAYGFGEIEGAELKIYPAKKVYSTDYKTYPEGYYFVKTSDEPVEFKSTNWRESSHETVTGGFTTGSIPYYTECIPAGDYILEETVTPSGFVTAEPLAFTIDTDNAVNVIELKDDHTKVEIEKYYTDTDGSEKLLKGAEFALYEAETDASGNVTYDGDGVPRTKGEALTAWATDEKGEYSDFAEQFEKMFESYGTKGTSVGWTGADGTAHTASYVTHEQYDQSLSGAPDTAFPTSALMTFKNDDGRVFRISVYNQSEAEGKISYEYGYEFDYKAMPVVNSHAGSYTTLGGTRRINYLEAGKSYVLKETKAPSGFARAYDRVIEVDDTADIQYYRVEDEEQKLLISKSAAEGTKELPGVKLSLYKAEGTEQVIDEAHLKDTWTSGTDGIYTSLEKIKGKIPYGYEVGDLKPHEVKDMEEGTYYLVEDEALPYYTAFAPIRIDYAEGEVNYVYRAVNETVKGTLTIVKTDQDGNPLSGASYTITGYAPDDLTTPVYENTVTAAESSIEITDLKAGYVGDGGQIIPYVYTVREILPPEGYAVYPWSKTFSFKPDNDGNPYAYLETAEETVPFTDGLTKVSFTKKDFDALDDDSTDGAFIKGAKMKVFEVTGTDENGEPLYDLSSPAAEWTTKEGEEKTVTGLIAGHTYILTEEEAPAGWNIMKPVMFTLSSDGRKVTGFSNSAAGLSANYYEESGKAYGTDGSLEDTIASVTIRGRYVASVVNTATDSDGNVIESWPAQGAKHVMSLNQGYKEGESYTVTELTTFTDGTSMVTDKVTKVFSFDEDGTCTMDIRGIDKVLYTLSFADGTYIDSLEATESYLETEVVNSTAPENAVITVTESGKEPGTGVRSGKALFNEISFYNPYHKASDLEITVETDSDTEIIDPGEGELSGNRLKFTVKDAEPYEWHKVALRLLLQAAVRIFLRP